MILVFYKEECLDNSKSSKRVSLQHGTLCLQSLRGNS